MSKSEAVTIVMHDPGAQLRELLTHAIAERNIVLGQPPEDRSILAVCVTICNNSFEEKDRLLDEYILLPTEQAASLVAHVCHGIKATNGITLLTGIPNFVTPADRLEGLNKDLAEEEEAAKS